MINSLEGRPIARPATLLELAIVSRLNSFVVRTLDCYFSPDRSSLPFPNLKPLDDGRLLYAAASGDNVLIAEYLFSNGVQINASSRPGSGALARAVYRNNLHVARVLLERGADLRRPGMYVEARDRRPLREDRSYGGKDYQRQSYWLEATPIKLGNRVRNQHAKTKLFDMYDWSHASSRGPWDEVAEELADIEKISQWPTGFAIDDFEIFVGDEKEAQSRDLIDDYFSSDDIQLSTLSSQALHVLDLTIEDHRDGGSIQYRTPEIIWDSQKSIDDQINLVQRYMKGLGRRAVVNIPIYDALPSVSLMNKHFAGDSLEPLLIKALEDMAMGCVMSELTKLGYTRCELETKNSGIWGLDLKTLSGIK